MNDIEALLWIQKSYKSQLGNGYADYELTIHVTSEGIQIGVGYETFPAGKTIADALDLALTGFLNLLLRDARNLRAYSGDATEKASEQEAFARTAEWAMSIRKSGKP